MPYSSVIEDQVLHHDSMEIYTSHPSNLCANTLDIISSRMLPHVSLIRNVCFKKSVLVDNKWQFSYMHKDICYNSCTLYDVWYVRIIVYKKDVQLTIYFDHAPGTRYCLYHPHYGQDWLPAHAFDMAKELMAEGYKYDSTHCIPTQYAIDITDIQEIKDLQLKSK